MKLILLFLLITLMSKISAQVKFPKSIDPLIREEYKKIKNLGSDTIIIYEQYCVGCEMLYFHTQAPQKVVKQCVYKGFIKGKIYWKLYNRYYSKEIACINDANIKITEVNGEIFEYFFSNLNQFQSIEKNKFNGKFFPPIPVHTSYEKLSLYTKKISHQILLAKQQKDNTNWNKYEWIPPSIKIMDIVKETYLHVNQ